MVGRCCTLTLTVVLKPPCQGHQSLIVEQSAARIIGISRLLKVSRKGTPRVSGGRKANGSRISGKIDSDSAGLPKCDGQACMHHLAQSEFVLPAFPLVLASTTVCSTRDVQSAFLPQILSVHSRSTRSAMNIRHVETTMKSASQTPQMKTTPIKLSRARKARIRLRQLHRRQSSVSRGKQ
jgi:hypothetical protein